MVKCTLSYLLPPNPARELPLPPERPAEEPPLNEEPVLRLPVELPLLYDDVLREGVEVL